jgi:cytochrome c oxidase subunit 2
VAERLSEARAALGFAAESLAAADARCRYEWINRILAKAEAWAGQYTVRTDEATGQPVVAPPEGGDAYVVSRLWSFWPTLELEKGKTYRLHLSSMDYNHGFSLQPVNINIQVLPGYEHVVTVTPNQTGTYSVVCNEFCGIGHHTMVGRIYVK